MLFLLYSFENSRDLDIYMLLSFCKVAAKPSSTYSTYYISNGCFTMTNALFLFTHTYAILTVSIQ